MATLKAILLWACTLACISPALAQQLYTSFYEEYRINVQDAATLLNGDVVIVAEHNLNGSLADTSHLIIRLGQDGEIIWTSSKGHATLGCVLNKVIATADSGFAVAGTVGPTAYFAKWSKNNVEEAKVSFDHLPNAPCTLYDVVQIAPDRYMVFGETYSNANNKMVATLLTLVVSGSSISIPDIGPLQKYVYQSATGASIYGRRIIPLTDSTYALAGNINNPTVPGANGIFVSVFNDSSNTFSVNRVYGAPFAIGSAEPLVLADFLAAPFPSTDYVIVANMPNSSKGVLFKVSATGSVSWAKQLPFTVINSAIIGADSTILVVGTKLLSSGNKTFLAKFESSGDFVWAKNLKQSLPFLALDGNLKKAVPASNGYILAGNSFGANLLTSRISTSGTVACNDVISQSATDISLISESYPLTLQPQKPANAPQTLTANVYEALRYTLCSTVVGIDEPSEYNVTVYPNPTQGQLTFSLPNAPQTLYIHDLYGSLVQTTDLQDAVSTITLAPEMGAGLYLYTIVTQSGNTINGKFIKQ